MAGRFLPDDAALIAWITANDEAAAPLHIMPPVARPVTPEVPDEGLDVVVRGSARAVADSSETAAAIGGWRLLSPAHRDRCHARLSDKGLAPPLPPIPVGHGVYRLGDGIFKAELAKFFGNRNPRELRILLAVDEDKFDQLQELPVPAGVLEHGRDGPSIERHDGRVDQPLGKQRKYRPSLFPIAIVARKQIKKILRIACAEFALDERVKVL